MNAEIALNAIIIILSVAVLWWVVGWAIYGGERGAGRKGGIFAILWKFVVTPFLIVTTGNPGRRAPGPCPPGFGSPLRAGRGIRERG